jgi:hypothetical protein
LKLSKSQTKVTTNGKTAFSLMTERVSNNPSIAFLTDEIHLVLSLACTFGEELGGVVIVTVLISGRERATL